MSNDGERELTRHGRRAMTTRLVRRSLGPLSKTIPTGRSRPQPLTGKRALVTGASSGVGAAAAVQLASEGVELVVTGRNGERLGAVLEQIKRRGGTAVMHTCDLTHPAEVEGLADAVSTTLGRVDLLVNNAGLSIRRLIAQSVDRADDFSRQIEANFVGHAELTTRLLPMLRASRGHVIFVSTWTVPMGTSPRYSGYHASKSALSAYARCFESEERRRGITATVLYLPLVHSPMSAPTSRFKELPGLSEVQAGELIVYASRYRPRSMTPLLSILARVALVLSPQRTLALLDDLG